jgi:hypothetical protein
MRRLLSASVFLACFLFPVMAGDQGVLVPREVFVGDRAEFTFTTALLSDVLDPAVVFALPGPELPLSPDCTVESVLAVRSDVDTSVTVRFVPWVSGNLQLPTVVIRGVSIVPPRVRIASLIEKTGRTALSPIRSPLLLPGTTWVLYGLTAAAVLALILVLFAAFRLAAYLARNPVQRQARRRVRTVMKQLKALDRQAGRSASSVNFGRLSSVLRGYLGSYACGDAAALVPATTTEVLFSLRSCLSLGPDSLLPGGIGSFLSDMDGIRFGGDPPSEPFAGYTSRVRDLVGVLESVRPDPAVVPAPEVAGEGSSGD